MTHRYIWWFAVAGLAIFSYLYSLDGMHIPSTGDEAPYLQITRLTAATGHWLPLQSVEGLGVTKPPLLFWQGLVASNWGQNWEMWRLRLPIVTYTFLSALMVFWVTRRLGSNNESAAIGAFAFLAFTAIFHHGRPYITNLPEVLFLSLAYFLVVLYRSHSVGRSYLFWIGIGILVGLAAWVRSIFLLAPVGLALSFFLLWQRQWHFVNFIKLDVPRLIVFVLTVVSLFGLWFIIDPNPEAIFKEFLLGENVSKLKTDGYWNNFFTGPYPVFSVWFGIFRNAGFLALPLLYVCLINFKNWSKLKPEEKALWIWIFAFIVVFTIPAQRQDSYVLATMPAVAVILGLHWQEIPHRWFYLFLLPLVLIFALLTYLMVSINQYVLPEGTYSPWHFFALVVGILLLLVSYLYNRWAPQLFIVTIFLSFIAFTSLVAPLEGNLGRYDTQSINYAKGKIVYAPSNFRAQYERYRFLLPGAEIRSYEYGDDVTRNRLISNGELVVVEVPPETNSFKVYKEIGKRILSLKSYKIIGRRLTVRSRTPPEEVKQALTERRMDLLFRQELLLQGELP